MWLGWLNLHENMKSKNAGYSLQQIKKPTFIQITIDYEISIIEIFLIQHLDQSRLEVATGKTKPKRLFS